MHQSGKSGKTGSAKKGVDTAEQRRRRSETTLKIRKEKKDDHLLKRRGFNPAVSTILYAHKYYDAIAILLTNVLSSEYSQTNLSSVLTGNPGCCGRRGYTVGWSS